MRWIAAVGLAMALLVGDALAWGGEGHRLIGELVYARLSAPARAEIDRLLASDPDGELEGCALRSFADATTWPDCARGKEAYAFSAPFHYDSLPLCGSAPRERYCPDGACATGAIARYRRVLADAARPDAERLEALAFLVHFVQDIHQPLHANANGDRGGNEVRVRFLGEEGFLGRDGQLRPFNLHGVWDTRLLPHVLKPDGSGRGEIAAMVDAYGELWREPDERVWARESNHWAWRRAQWPLPVPLTCGAPPRQTVDLDQAYVDQAAPVVRQRKRAFR